MGSYGPTSVNMRYNLSGPAYLEYNLSGPVWYRSKIVAYTLPWIGETHIKGY